MKVYSGLFSDCHVQPDVWKDCKGKYYFKFFFPGILQEIQSTAIFKTFLSLETDIGDNLIFRYFQNLQEAREPFCWPVKVGGKISNFGGLESVNVFDVNGLARGVFMGIAFNEIEMLILNDYNLPCQWAIEWVNVNILSGLS